MNNFASDTDFSSLLDAPESAAAIFLETKPVPPVGEKYIIFALDNEYYAVHHNLVAEVLNPLPVTPLPGMPEWLAGMTNLRGRIISVVNLRKFWKKNSPQPQPQPMQKNKFIILRSAKEDNTTIAFIVDRVGEIVTLTPQDIKFSAADFENSFPTLFGKAVYKHGTSLLLFDAENLLSSLSLNGFER